MNVSARSPRVARVALCGACLLGALSLVSGCSKKLTTADASYTMPEGVPASNARLIVYPDLPITIGIWKDKTEHVGESDLLGTWNPKGPQFPDGDSLVSERTLYTSGAGAIHGVIIDGSAADGFEVLRRESGGGLRALQGFVLQPLRRWLETGEELYQFTDLTPSGYQPASYFGRGLLQNAVRKESPVTNEARLASATVGAITIRSAAIQTDSLFTVKWDPVPGAVAYWIHIFEFQPTVTDVERRLAAAPAPIVTAPTRDFLVALLPGSATQYRIGEGATRVMIYQKLAFRFGRAYQVRIAAIDSDNRLLAMTLGDSRQEVIVLGTVGEAGNITVSPRGATIVNTLAQ